jgi:hypothetical protein
MRVAFTGVRVTGIEGNKVWDEIGRHQQRLASARAAAVKQ